MRVLVTGAAGFIGSHLCERLVADGHDVVGVDAFIPFYPRQVKERNLATLSRTTRFRFVEADLRSADLGPLVAGTDVIVHQAAMAGAASWERFDEYVTCNLSATQRLLEATRLARREHETRFIQISTSSVYGTQAIGAEDTVLRPASPYGITKLAAEQLAFAYGRAWGIPVVALRYFSIYGPRQRPDMAYHVFIDALLRGTEVSVHGDGTQSRGNTFIDDCIDGTVRAIHDARPGEAYNIGGGVAISLNEAIAILESLAGARLRRRGSPPRPGDQLHTRADIAKARRDFGFQPSVTPDQGLRRQFEWQRSLATTALLHDVRANASDATEPA